MRGIIAATAGTVCVALAFASAEVAGGHATGVATTTSTTIGVTSTTIGVAPSTVGVAAPVAAPLFPSLDEFVADWTFANIAASNIHPDAEAFMVDTTALRWRTFPAGVPFAGMEGFAALIDTHGFLGGVVDPKGAVVALVLAGDPDAAAITTSLATLFVVAGSADVEPLTTAYVALVTDAESIVQQVVSGPNTFTMLEFPGSEADDVWNSVAVTPGVDGVTAVLDANALTVFAGDLALSEPVATATPGSATAPTSVALTSLPPVSTPPLGPTTAPLPTVGLITAPPTTAAIAPLPG